MLSHAEIWAAIDALAARQGLTASGLAKLSGLDPTTFSRSKRFSRDVPPRLRWPSTESVLKALAATDVSFSEFATLTGDGDRARRRAVPLIGLAQAGDHGFFDDAGFPVGHGWDEIDVEENGGVYALEIAGNSLWPVYRDGDRLIVQPIAEPRQGDRVIVKMRSGEVTADEMGRVLATHMELTPLNPTYPVRALDRTDIAWVARILWVSQ